MNPILLTEPDKWISVNLTNGLGNRLFQISACLFFAEKTNRQPLLFLPRMSRYEHNCWSLFLKLVPNLPILYSANEWQEISEENSDEVFSSVSKGIVLKGWFQDSSFFPSGSNVLRRMEEASCRLPFPILPAPLPKTEKVLAVHFRFGDYSILPHHQIPLAQYYLQTIQQFPPGTPLRIFSDSIEKTFPIAQELNALGYPTTIFISRDVLQTLHDFASCSLGSICSNSTFAWWAAYFAYMSNRDSNYKAYFPNIWLQGKKPMNLFNLPFTHPVAIETLPQTPYLKSFFY
jgi:hypothetical protein